MAPSLACLEATGAIEIGGADVEFQYKQPALWTSGKIVMSKICLAPRRYGAIDLRHKMWDLCGI